MVRAEEDSSAPVLSPRPTSERTHTPCISKSSPRPRFDKWDINKLETDQYVPWQAPCVPHWPVRCSPRHWVNIDEDTPEFYANIL
ncbi:hypothetical protein E2C01_028519 [Portunus trituberculatus]|uniref:Uncharacterized protein n=1 Tax=Portunus trituberculatus TaxID=210409 RepID=A0A5B7ENU8_PORTR|nr:hypothetical protein [Portunus trituberculatus]